MHKDTLAQGYQMSIYYPFHSRASDVTFFEIQWDKKLLSVNPALTTHFEIIWKIYFLNIFSKELV